MRRGSWLPLFLLWGIGLGWGLAPAEAQSYCNWVCVGDDCRLERGPDATCDPAPAWLPVTADEEAVSCVPDSELLPCYDTPVGTGDDPVPVPDDDETSFFVSPLVAEEDVCAYVADTPSAITLASEPQPAKLDVLLTGFCSFPGQPENPTEKYLPDIEKKVKEKCGADINLKTQCLKVEKDAITKCKVKNQIVISLGVAAGTNKVRIETAAVNCYVHIKQDGTRIVKCDPVCIDPTKPIDNTVKAPGPWPVLPPGHQIGPYPVQKGDVDKTNDYVCNATFYWLCTQKECKPYFVHVPDFRTLPVADRDSTIDGIADLICKIVAANKNPAPAPRRSFVTGQ